MPPGGLEPLDELAARTAQGPGNDDPLARRAGLRRACGSSRSKLSPVAIRRSTRSRLSSRAKYSTTARATTPPTAFDLGELVRLSSAQEVFAAEAVGDELGRHGPRRAGCRGRNRTREKGCSLLFSIAWIEVLRALLAEALERRDLVRLQLVHVRRVFYEAEVEETGGDLLAEALYVHRGLGGPVDDVLQRLRGAAGVHAAGNGLALGAGDRLAADGAHLWHLERSFVAGAFLGMARTTCGITSPARSTTTVSPIKDALLLDIVLVVQRGARDGHPADVDRLEQRLGRQGPGSPDLDDDVVAAWCGRQAARTCTLWPSAGTWRQTPGRAAGRASRPSRRRRRSGTRATPSQRSTARTPRRRTRCESWTR